MLQTEAAECGIACLAMIASYFGHRIDLDTLRRRHPVSLKGMTLRALIEPARHLELACRPLRIELAHLGQLRMPAILHWDMNHFVVLKSASRRGLVIHDPASGQRRLSFEEASKHLSGVAVELWPLAGFEARDERTRLPLSAFFGRVRGTVHALAQIFALSIILEIGIIAAPFYMQLAIDQVIASGDVDLLVVLAFGFGLVTGDYRRRQGDTLSDEPQSAEHLALCNGKSPVSPSGAAAALLFREAPYRRHSLPLHLARADPERRRRRAHHRDHRWTDGHRHLDRSLPVQPGARRRDSRRLPPLSDFEIGAISAVPRAQRSGDPQQGAGKFGADRDAAGNPEPQALQPRKRAGKPMAEPLCQCYQRRGPYRPHKDPLYHAERSDLRARKHRHRLPRCANGSERSPDHRHDLRHHGL